MKFTNLLGLIALSVTLACPVGELQAQNQARKTTTTKSTTTTKKTSTAKKGTATRSAAATGTPISLEGKKYIGICKIPNSPLDGWFEVNLQKDNNTINLAGNNFPIEYKATKSGKNQTMIFNIVGNAQAKQYKSTLKSTDSGSSFSGTLKLPNSISWPLWILEIPAESTPVNMSDEELTNIICSPDGYTALVKINKGSDISAATSEFIIDKDNKTWKLAFDSPTMQKMFSSMQGDFDVKDNKLILKNAGGTIEGKVYNDGTYIVTQMETGRSASAEIILIR